MTTFSPNSPLRVLLMAALGLAVAGAAHAAPPVGHGSGAHAKKAAKASHGPKGHKGHKGYKGHKGHKGHWIAPGAARVKNRSEVRMRIAIDGVPMGVLRPGEALETGALSPGRHVMVARPVGFGGRGGQAVRRTFHVNAGELSRVRIGAWLGTLEIRNPFPRPAAVFVDGQRVGRVHSGGTLVLTEQRPGVHRVSLRGHARILAESTVSVRSGEGVRWEPAFVRTGTLRVSNTSHRRMRVRVNGERIGFLMPGETRVLRDVPVGSHRVVARAHGGMRFSRYVQVRRGGEAVVALGATHHAPVYTASASPYGGSW